MSTLDSTGEERMNKLTIELENCYGISKFLYGFEFSTRNVYAIYAPNGSMKSSFARTLHNISKGEPTIDLIYPDRKCIRKVTDEVGAELPKDNILVLIPYDEALGHTEKTSTLLVNDLTCPPFLVQS